MLVLAITTQDSSDRQVRATEPKILSLIDARLSHSATLRRRVATLNDSDIVNIEPRHTRQALGGYLAHNIPAVQHSTPFTSSPRVPDSQVSGHSSSTESPAAMRTTTEPPMIRVRSTGDTAVTKLLHDAFERS